MFSLGNAPGYNVVRGSVEGVRFCASVESTSIPNEDQRGKFVQVLINVQTRQVIGIS